MNPIADFLFFYPLGIVILWLKHRGRKSFKEIIKEHEAYELKVRSVSFLLKIVAGAGALFMFLVVVYMLGSLLWKGLSKLFL
jgi:hypothetical protein